MRFNQGFNHQTSVEPDDLSVSTLKVYELREVVQFSCSVVSDSLQPREPQHTMPPCPSPTPRVYPNLCSLSW